MYTIGRTQQLLLKAGSFALAISTVTSIAFATTRNVTITNCDGSVLSSTSLESENRVSVKIIAAKGQAQSVTLKNADAAEALKPFSSSDSIATFIEVADGSWTACNEGGTQILSAEVLPAAGKSNLAMIGAGIVGVGSAIGIAVGGDSNNSEERISPPAAAPSETTTTSNTTTSNARDVTAKPVEVVSNTKDCVGLKTLAATTGCRNKEDVEPFSPYR